MTGGNLSGPILPKTTRTLAELSRDNPRFPLESRQVGLHLDKFTEISQGNEEQKKRALHEVVEIGGNNELLQNLQARHSAALEAIGACSVEMKTDGPLTLHISRGGTWENAGICLHPVYGFAYIPGTGIKGLVRSWAETIWAQGQDNKEEAWHRIDNLFGYGANSESHKFSSPRRNTPGWRPDGIHPKQAASAGRLVFHDAWPTAWPCLEVDITNNHHTKYYSDEGKSGHGDWEDPVPVYFLCVQSNTSFDFAISDRKPCGDDAIEEATKWLVDALQTNGVGAKTAAGYGRFVATGSPRQCTSTVPRRREYKLELVSPAFLAGADQKREDCDLRGATLRGLLRWWWRTMYAGIISLEMLRLLEATIWGNVESGSPISLAVRNTTGNEPMRFVKSDSFLNNHDIPPHQVGPGKATLGLDYTTYGMAEKKKNRWYRPEETHWQVVLTAKNTWFRRDANPSVKLTADEVERQAAAALWLLCRYGGVGAKSRKGFGSLADISIPGINSLEDCSKLAKDFAIKCEIPTTRQEIYGPSLRTALFMEDLPTEWDNARFVCNIIGEALKAATKSLDKRDLPALGMPREKADSSRFLDKRHASPVLWSLSRHPDGKLAVRILAFPSPRLPDIFESENILRKFVELVKTEISNRSRKHPRSNRAHHLSRAGQNRNFQSGSEYQPRSNSGNAPVRGSVVECEILDETTKKGKLRAKHIKSGRNGPIIDNAPGDVKPGQKVELFVHAIHPDKSITFMWTPLKKNKSNQSRARESRHSRGSRRRRR